MFVEFKQCYIRKIDFNRIIKGYWNIKKGDNK